MGIADFKALPSICYLDLEWRARESGAGMQAVTGGLCI